MHPDAATRHDTLHLRRALELASAADRGAVSPNPLVGAVLAHGEAVIGEGAHLRLGGLHAERAALEDCRSRGGDPRGATLYVTLEPCAHQGRQPPCAEALIEAGVGRVVYASDDPSEKASGRGPGMLRDSGITVEQAGGGEAAAARLLNQPFRKHARTGRPLVIFKMATSLDGRVAATGGDSKWISGESSRALVHRWRAECDAIAVGIGTALADDPLLTARDVGATRQPLRVVFDSGARLAAGSSLRRSLAEAPLTLITGPQPPAAERLAELRDSGVEVIVAAGESRAEQVSAALDILGRQGISSLFLEGGPTLAASFAAAGEIDEIRLFVAPVLLGGGRALLDGEGPLTIAEAQRALDTTVSESGSDALIEARMRGVVAMFTGLIQEIGTVASVDTGGDGSRIEIEAVLATELGGGDSVSVNGACLTATAVSDRSFAAEVMNQSLGLTTLGDLAAGRRVNLEPALRASDRLGGHFVQGHVDGVAEVLGLSEDGISRRLRFSLEPRLAGYLVPQGSIAIDGASLTVASLAEGSFEVALIPETLERTTLGELNEGSRVNLECDLLAKHLERLVSPLTGKDR